MLGPSFIGFVILLTIAVAVSTTLHYGCKYYVTPGVWSYISKLVVSWIGAWLGTPVFGAWLLGLNFQNIYFIPAILGSIALTIVVVDVAKTFRRP